MLRFLVSQKWAYLCFIVSWIGFAILIISMVIGAILVGDHLSRKNDLPQSFEFFQHLAGIAGIVFIIGSFFLWLRAFVKTIILLRAGNGSLFRLFFVLIGSVFAAHILFFVDWNAEKSHSS